MAEKTQGDERMSEYNLGYFEGVRNVMMMWHACLKRIEHEGAVELQLQSDSFFDMMSAELKEALRLRDQDE